MSNKILFALKMSFKLMARKSARSHFHVYSGGLQLLTVQNLNDNLGSLLMTSRRSTVGKLSTFREHFPRENVGKKWIPCIEYDKAIISIHKIFIQGDIFF